MERVDFLRSHGTPVVITSTHRSHFFLTILSFFLPFLLFFLPFLALSLSFLL